MSNEVDILEDDILKRDPELLEILLIDRSRPKNGHIVWATDNYASKGAAFDEDAPITKATITGKNGDVIQPRTNKSKEEQQSRARDKGEVFTPSWICNNQNNLVDNEWFGVSGLFNEEKENGWVTNPSPIPFPTAKGQTWQDYVADTRLEITCGEAPYLVSRYDTISGDRIPVKDRIGILDRKLRVIGENTAGPDEWYQAVLIAYKNTYAYEWQGDNLLLARENALYTFDDNFKEKFGGMPTKEQAREIAEIISWNFWQMDGLKGVIPNTCHEDKIPSLFGDEDLGGTPCPGCANDDIRQHNGIKCKIMDWEKGKPILYIDLIKR